MVRGKSKMASKTLVYHAAMRALLGPLSESASRPLTRKYPARYCIERLETRRLLSTFSTLASFPTPASTSGSGPLGNLVEDSSGDLFGTATGGGANSDGTVFELTNGSSTFTTIATFNGTNGSAPEGGVVVDSNGDLFGTASAGGANNFGDVWEIVNGASTITDLANFNSTLTGKTPIGAIVMDGSGDIFGTAEQSGASGDGTIWELLSGASSITTLAAFNGTNGKNPYGGIVLNSGNIYGTTKVGGAPNEGVIYELSGGTITVLHSFSALVSSDNADGANPLDQLVMDSNGNLYGTTNQGGANGDGTVFEYSTGNTTFATIASFTGSTGATAVGKHPYAGLTMDAAGNLFGATQQGATNSDGSIFVVLAGSSTLTDLHTLGASGDGVNPEYGAMLMDAKGDLFGETFAGGANNFGTVFEVSPSTMLAFKTQPSTVTAGVADSPSITVAVENQWGDTLTGDTSNVTLSINTGPGSIGGTDTVAAVAGVATFSNVVIDTSGSYTLAASDGSDTGANSSSFTVNPAAASKVVYNVQPSAVTAGVADSPSIVVDVEDQFNNIVTTDSSNVTLAIASGPGSIGGTDTVAASSGVATFSNVVLDTAGSYTLTASDGSLTTATSSSFTVSAASAAELAFGQQPTNVTAGSDISPGVTVKVEDQFGNLVTGDTSNVTIAVNSGPGSISGTLTEAASGGIATFSDLSLTAAGAYTLAASDSGDTGANSNSFTVSAASASKVVYNVSPSSGTAGEADSPSIVVDVEDQYGNVVTTDSSNVTVAVASGPGSATGTDTVAASSGIATFSNVIFDTPGSYTLTASDASLSTATSGSFTVSPASASKVAFSVQPSDVSAGVADSPSIVVDVEDSLGNIITSDNSDVTLTVASGPGSASGTLTVAASSGVATFSNVKFDTAGSYTLTASDGSLTSATSSGFTVSAAAASKLAYSVQPSAVTAGVADSPSIVVDVEDQFGNIVTGDSSNVTLAAASGPGSATGTLTVAASSGVATFSNVKFDTAGSYTLTASDGSLTTATSSSFNVTPAAASKVAYSVQPSDVVAGVADSPSIVVDVEDQFGNIVTSNSSNVTLAVASGPGSASGTLTVAASSGVATFSNVKLDTTGTYTLTASDGSLTSATSNSFNVTPAAASKVIYNVQPSSVTAGVADSPSIVVDVEDQFGNIVTGNSSNVTLAVATGPGSVSGTTTVAASSGVATFSNAKLDTAGSYTLTASDSGLTSATSSSFTVTPAAAAKLAYSVQPSDAVAGLADSPSIVVDVEDQFGNIVTSDSSNVTLSVATGPGSLSGTDTVAASSGVATFSNVILDTTGAYTLTASDGSLTSATSGSFNVNPPGPSQLAFFVQPSSVVAGIVESPSIVVDVEDQFGNIVTSNSSNVTLSIATGPGSLSGTLTVAASSGVATFSNIKLDTTGSYTLTASDGSLTSATSNSFTVTPAAATKVVYSVQPSNVTAGVADSPSIVVDVEDQFGNVVTGNSSNVTLAVATGPGSLSGTTTVAASSGIATFSNAILDTAGSYTLTASDGVLTSETSGSFTASPAAASKVVYSVQPSNATAGVADSPSIVVDVEDQFGNIASGNSSNVTLAVATGPGSASGTLTVAASSGVATFSNVILDTAGSYTLAASDGSLTSATSSAFTVAPAAASKVVYSVQPSNVVAGVVDSPSIVVDIEDQFGNIVTGNSSNVTLSAATGPGSLSGTTTVAASSGVATFNNVELDTAGTYTLRAADGGLTPAVSNSMTVSHAAAAGLAFAQTPADSQVGDTITPAVAVDVVDAFGNLVTSNNSNVTIALTTGPGTLSGTLTVAASSGVASFSNLSINAAGADKLTATDGSLTPATSSTFFVGGVLTKLVVVSQTDSTTPTGTVPLDVTVAGEDQFGALVTTNTSTVTATIHARKAGGAVSETASAQLDNGYAIFHLSLPGGTGTYSVSFGDGVATAAAADPVQLRSVPLKFQWWYKSTTLSSSSSTIEQFASPPPIDSAAPALSALPDSEPLVAAFTPLPTSNTNLDAPTALNANNPTDLLTANSALNNPSHDRLLN